MTRRLRGTGRADRTEGRVNDSLPKPEQIAYDMFSEAAPVLTGVMMHYLRRQQAGQQTFSAEEAAAVATMAQIWTELGDYFIQRVRAEFPRIRDRQYIELLIEESRGPADD